MNKKTIKYLCNNTNKILYFLLHLHLSGKYVTMKERKRAKKVYDGEKTL